MPPRVTSKPAPLPNRNIIKTTTLKVRSSPRLKSMAMSRITTTTARDVTKAIGTPFDSKKQLNNTNKNSIKENVSTLKNAVTPKKVDRPVEAESATKSATKSGWKRRPKPAHSGVPVPEKMKKMLAKYLTDDNNKL